jgi:hypothetical protein
MKNLFKLNIDIFGNGQKKDWLEMTIYVLEMFLTFVSLGAFAWCKFKEATPFVASLGALSGMAWIMLWQYRIKLSKRRRAENEQVTVVVARKVRLHLVDNNQAKPSSKNVPWQSIVTGACLMLGVTFLYFFVYLPTRSPLEQLIYGSIMVVFLGFLASGALDKWILNSSEIPSAANDETSNWEGE